MPIRMRRKISREGPDGPGLSAQAESSVLREQDCHWLCQRNPRPSGRGACRAPGMGADLVVKVHYGAWLWQPLAKGKGVHREVKSEGSRRQNLAPRNTNRIRQVQLDEPATYGEVLYDQELQVYMRRRHERKVSVLTRGALPAIEAAEVSRGHINRSDAGRAEHQTRYSAMELAAQVLIAETLVRGLRPRESGEARRTDRRA